MKLTMITLAAAILITSEVQAFSSRESCGPNGECGIAIITTGIVGVTTSTIALLKEDVEVVEQDALDFLAGEPMSLSLQELLDKTRAENEQLIGLSDQELTSILLKKTIE